MDKIEDTARKAPGCFAAASVFGSDSKACQQCVAFAECGVASVKTLEEIKGMIDVRDLLARHSKARKKSEAERIAALPPEPEPVVATAPQPAPIVEPVERKTSVAKIVFDVSADHQDVIANITNGKAKTQAIVLCKQNKIESAVRDLAAGVNPFAESPPKYLRVVCDLLLGGGFTRASCKEALIAQLGWSDGTAAAHVSMACAVVAAFNIAQETSGVFALSPALGCENTNVV